MAQITLTLDLNQEALSGLQALLDALNKKPVAASLQTGEQLTFDDIPAVVEKPVEKPVAAKTAKTVAAKSKPAEPAKPVETSAAAKEVSKTDVRAVALKLSKAGKQSVLKDIFAKYGAEKLSDIAERDFPALMADLEAAND